jgi:PAS domain S-box-containing protein
MKTQVETRHASAARNADEHRADEVLRHSDACPPELAQKLQRNEFYLSEGQRLAHMGSWTFNASGFGYWSSGLFRIHGLAPGGKAPTVEEYMGLIHPDDREFVAETIRKMLAEGNGFDFTKRIVRPDGEIRCVRCVGVPSTRDGTFQEFVGTGMDVTEQERILNDLKRSEFYLAEGQRLSHAGSWSSKPDLTCDYWSRELYEILGFDPKNGIPTISDYFTRVHPEDRAVVEATIKGMIAAGEGCDLKKRIVRPDGVQRVIRCVGTPVRENGVITRFVGTLMDITEQEELIQELRRSKAHLTNAQRLSRTGSVGMEVRTQRIYWSEESARIYGYPPGTQPTPELILQRVHPDDVALLKNVLERAAQGGQDFEFEHRLLMPDGSIKYIFNLSQCLRDEAGNEEIIGAITDITERKLAEEAIRRSEAYLAEAQMLSHTGSFGWKPHTGEIIWSAETYRIFEYDLTVTPTIGLVAQRVHPEDRAGFQSVIERVSGGASDFEHTYRLLMPDGRTKHVHALAHTTQDASGNREFVGAVTDITDQKRAEESLRASEAYLADAQKLSGTGSWAWHPEVGITYWSEESYRVQGFDPRDGLPSTEQFFQRIHPDDQPAMMELMQRLSREKVAVETNFRIVHPSGAVRDIHSTCHPVFNPSGKFIEFIGTMIDVTERKRVEEELRASEARHRHLVDTTPALIHTALPNGGLDFFNRGWLEYLGLPITDLLGWRWTAAIHPEDVEELLNKWRASLESGQPLVVESRVRRADGKYRWFLHRKQPQRNEAGEIVKWYGSSIEIEERKIAEEAIRRSEAYLADAQKLTHIGSWTRDPATSEFLYCSEEMLRIFEWDPQQGLPTIEMVRQRIHPDDLNQMQQKNQKSRQQKTDYTNDFRVVLPSGTKKFIHSLTHFKFGETGEVVEWFGTVMDVTERKRAEALLIGEKNLHEMIATGVALKEILNALCLMIEEQRSGTLASVLLICPDGIHLESLAGPSLPEGWTRQIASLPIGPCAGSCGTAAYRGSPVIVSNIATDPLWAVPDHRASALSYGLRASWSYPILSSDGKVLGTFCQYYRETRSPSPSDLDLIELAAHLARVAIERREAVEQLRRSEAFLSEGQRLSRTGNWRWNASTGKLTWSQELFRIYGFDPQTTNPSMDLFWERVHPDDRIDLKRDFESAVREKRDLEREFRIVTPDWSIRHLHGVGCAVLNEANELVEFTGSTVDITERKRAEGRAQSHDEAVRLALNAFVKELDVHRFLEHMITGLTKQFEAASSELWLFDDTTQLASLYMTCHQGRVIGAEAVGHKKGISHVTWQLSNVGRMPKIIELPAQKSLLQPAHFESLKNQDIKTLVLVPLVLGEQNLGFIELHFREEMRLTSVDLDHAQALVHHATLALQLSRLAHRTEQMAVMEERNRMAREIHDTLAQAFAGVVLHSEALGTALGMNKSRSKKALSNIQKLARSGLEEARRSVQALRPRALEGRTLTQALAQEAKRLPEDGKHSCEFIQKGEALKLSAEIQNELFRIAQEAMTNISKHAQAKSVWITLEFKDNQAILTVRDDGIGFAATDSPKTKGGYGLSTMRERALRIGGKLEIKSAASGGTAIRVVVPLDKKLQLSNHST